MTPKSLRPFIGSRDFATSRAFYTAMGFGESRLSDDMSVFTLGAVSFYLQDAYVKDWVDNTMLFLEVDDLDDHYAAIRKLDLPKRFTGVRISDIKEDTWGREYFVHDPSGVLWHIGSFSQT